jgi:hypothetical protein
MEKGNNSRPKEQENNSDDELWYVLILYNEKLDY